MTVQPALTQAGGVLDGCAESYPAGSAGAPARRRGMTSLSIRRGY
jgi:hypothetical protein